ncbi:MAG TPA: hypothetical protein VEI97_03305 [bacterium]|nr:hypothetical protein [bacterium]
MTLHPIERCLRDPLWWAALTAVVLLAYALVRIPSADIQPLSGTGPLILEILPHDAQAVTRDKGMGPLLVASYLIAFVWPALVLAGARPQEPEVSATPHALRELAKRSAAGSLLVGGVVLLALVPVLALGLKGRNLPPAAAISFIVLVLAQPSWIGNLALLTGDTVRRRAAGVPLVWALAVTATYVLAAASLALARGTPAILDLAFAHGSLAALLWGVVLLRDLPDTRAEAGLPEPVTPIPDPTPSTGGAE